MFNITTLGLTVLALMTPSQICEESGIFAEQLQRYRQYGITLTYNPSSLYNATGNRDVNAEYVAAIIKFALSQPVQPTRRLKNLAISRARYQVEALCYKTLRR